jgi:dTDP-4-dehydrorhamnose 3,5-epimerase
MMEFEATRLPEVILIKPRLFGDARGFVLESWHEQKFAAAGINARFVQDNDTHSVLHTLRGLHFQVQQPQGKLVRVTRGEVFDVAVDIRRSSPRFGQWVGVVLSGASHHMLWIPPGFAHGYLALSDEIDFVYKCTDFYAPQHERIIRWDDRQIGVNWPLPAGIAPRLSARDAAAPLLKDVEREL